MGGTILHKKGDKTMPAITNPTTVVASAYDTSGNGGRKLVRLSNGWLVAGVYDPTNRTIYLYKSQDNGQTWSQLWYVDGAYVVSGFALASSGNTVHLLYTVETLNRVYHVKIDALNPPNNYTFFDGIMVDQNQNGFSGVSLTIAPDGTLHAAWSSKNSTYPNSFNIRYSKSTDGGQTWEAPTQLTMFNTTTDNVKSVCVVARPDGNPVVVFEFNTSTTYYSIRSISYNGSSWGSQVYVYPASNQQYPQSSPCAVVDNDGVIHVVWMGSDSTDTSGFNIKYSKSTDGGQTWSPMYRVTTGSGNQHQYPTVTVDKNNKLYVVFAYRPSGTNYQGISLVTNTNGTWGSVTSLVSQGTTANITHPSALLDNAVNFTDPLIIYQDNQSGAVKFRGSWTSLTITVTGKTFPLITWIADGGGETITETRLKVNGTVKHTVSNPTGDIEYTLSLDDLNDGDNTIEIDASTATTTEKKVLSAVKTFTFKQPLELVPDTYNVTSRFSVVPESANESYQDMDELSLEIIDEGKVEVTLLGTPTIAEAKGTVRLTASRQDSTMNKSILSITGGVS
jgi:hypothetical protein